MRLVRIYQPGDYTVGDLVELSPTAAQHIGVVLRMQHGETLTLFAGENKEFDAVITNAQRKKITVSITAVHQISRESPQAIHLAQALSKGERMEWVMQKATELGVASIIPIVTAHCAVKLDKARIEKKLAQWRAITIGACEQCGRNQLPVVKPVTFLADYLADSQKKNAVLRLVLTPATDKTWRDYPLRKAPDVCLLIGPEGGFSKEELQQILAAHFLPLSLGPRVLRTETAAIAALSVLQAVYGDL